MRLTLGCLLLLSAVGCKTVSPTPPCAGPATSGCLTHADGHCPLQAAGHPCPVCDKKKEKDRGLPRSEEESQPREAVVTQDIMLVPRMVYVPYAPQTPVSPARLGSLVPAGRAMDIPRETPGTRDTPPTVPEKQICETLDRCCTMMQMMDKRICELECQLKNPPAVQLPPVIIESPKPGPRCVFPFLCKPQPPCFAPAQ